MEGYTGPKVCVVMGCPFKAIVQDTKNYSKWRQDKLPIEEMGPLDEGREIWYCREHAIQYLFPIIDDIMGNSTDAILGEFKTDGML